MSKNIEEETKQLIKESKELGSINEQTRDEQRLRRQQSIPIKKTNIGVPPPPPLSKKNKINTGVPPPPPLSEEEKARIRETLAKLEEGEFDPDVEEASFISSRATKKNREKSDQKTLDEQKEIDRLALRKQEALRQYKLKQEALRQQEEEKALRQQEQLIYLKNEEETQKKKMIEARKKKKEGEEKRRKKNKTRRKKGSQPKEEEALEPQEHEDKIKNDAARLIGRTFRNTRKIRHNRELEEETRQIDQENIDLQEEQLRIQQEQERLQKRIKEEREMRFRQEDVDVDDICLKEQNDYVGIGISNIENNCYINAVFQMFYHMCYFRKELINNDYLKGLNLNLDELKEFIEQARDDPELGDINDYIRNHEVLVINNAMRSLYTVLELYKTNSGITNQFTVYNPLNIPNDLMAAIKCIKLIPPQDPFLDKEQDDITDIISNLLKNVDLTTNGISNKFIFGKNNEPFSYLYPLSINAINFSGRNEFYLSNVIEKDVTKKEKRDDFGQPIITYENDVKKYLYQALSPNQPLFRISQKYLIFNINRYYDEDGVKKKYTYSIIPDPILYLCEHTFILKGIIAHVGGTGDASSGHYIYITFNNGNEISGVYNDQRIYLFKHNEKKVMIFEKGQLPIVSTDYYTMSLNSAKQNVENDGYIYLYEKILITSEEIIELVSEPIPDSWFRRLLKWLQQQKNQVIQRFIKEEVEGDLEEDLEEGDLEEGDEEEGEKKSWKDYFIKNFPSWLIRQDEETQEAVEEAVEEGSAEGNAYLKALSNFLSKPKEDELSPVPNKFEDDVYNGIILAKNILNIRSERTVTKSELRNNTNKLLYIIENNFIPNTHNRIKLIKIAFNFLIEIPEKLTKIPQYKETQTNEEKEKIEKIKNNIKSFLLTINWQGLKKMLDLMNSEKYKELNFNDTTILLRSRIHNKTMKRVNNNNKCMKYKSGNICKETGQLTPIIITERGYPSQIRKLTRKTRLELVDKNVKDRKEGVEKETERIEKEKITNQLQNQLKSLENLKEKVNFINNEDIKKQIDFYTRRLTDLNDTLLNPDDNLTDDNRKEIANILIRTKEIQKDLQEK